MASSRGVEYFQPDNPDVPYLAIKLEDTVYDIEYNYLENITINRKEDDIGDFNFSIVNYMDLNLENKFLQLLAAYTSGLPPISFQYGWRGGQKSRWYRGYLLEYNPVFLPGGYMQIGMNGTLAGISDTINMVASFKGSSISDIVQKIAENKNWVIDDIEPSTPFSEERSFTLNNVDPTEYIRTYLEPYAMNSKKEPFKFYIETFNDNETHISFVSVNKKVGAAKNYNFFYNHGNYGSVLSWAPNYSGQTMKGFLQSAVFDLDTNDICIYGSEAKAAEATGASLTVYGATSPDRMEAMLANKWYHTNIGCLTASLEVVGDPLLTPQMHVNVVPMDPKGQPHPFTAGTYRILQITDTLDDAYRTKLELIKEGVEDGSKTLSLNTAVTYKGQV